MKRECEAYSYVGAPRACSRGPIYVVLLPVGDICYVCQHHLEPFKKVWKKAIAFLVKKENLRYGRRAEA